MAKRLTQPSTPAQRLIARAQAEQTIKTTKTNLLATLEDLTNDMRKLESDRRSYVIQAREKGASWSEIGARLGVSRQAAQMRYGR